MKRQILQLLMVFSLNFFPSKVYSDYSIILKNTVSKKDLNNFLEKINKEKKIIITLEKDLDVSPENLNIFFNELKKLNIQKTCICNQLDYKNHRILLNTIINNLDVFHEIEFGILKDLIPMLEDKLFQLNLQKLGSSTSIFTSNDKKKTITTLIYLDRKKNMNLSLKYEEDNQLVRTSPVSSNSIFDLLFDDERIQQSSSPKKNNKNNPLIDRAKKILAVNNNESLKVNPKIQQKIKTLLEKMENRSNNPNLESEQEKIKYQLKGILDMVTLPEEDNNPNNLVNQLLDLKIKKSNDYLSFFNNAKKKIWETLEPSDSAVEIIDKLFNLIDNVVVRKLNKNFPSKNNDLFKDDRRQVLLLHGEPGLGKTSVARDFARINGFPSAIINIEDKKQVTGTPAVYVGSNMGKIAYELAVNNGIENIENGKGNTTIIFIIDEIDKYSKEIQNSLLSLFDSSQDFTDQFLEIPIPVENCIFILTANDINAIEKPLVDRCTSIRVKPLSIENKRNILLKTLNKQLYNLFPNVKFEISKDILTAIVNKSEGLGARQLKINADNLINYISNKYINTTQKNIIITHQLVKDALYLIENTNNLIRAEESKAGYINGPVFMKEQNPYVKENKFYSMTNISCFASNEFNNQHVIIPIDHNLQSLIQGLSRSMTLLLNSMQLSNKNMSINIKDVSIANDEHRALSSLIAIAWVSAIAGRKIKSQSTIIAEALPNNDVEFDPKTIMKIQLAYNHGIRHFVIARSKPTSLDQDNDTGYSNIFLNVINVFKLKRKQTNDLKKEVYYHNGISGEDSLYPGLEICVVDNLKEAIDYLLIDNN